MGTRRGLSGEHFGFRLLLAGVWFAICLSIYVSGAGNKFFPLFSWDLYSAAKAPSHFYDIRFRFKSGERAQLTHLQEPRFNKIKMWDLRERFHVANGECPDPEEFRDVISAIQHEATKNSSYGIEGATLIVVHTSLAEFLFEKGLSPAETECFELF